MFWQTKRVNYNPETGISFGVIAISSIDGDIAADLWDLAYAAEYDRFFSEHQNAEIRRLDGNPDDIDPELRDEWLAEHGRSGWQDDLPDFIVDEPEGEFVYMGVTVRVSSLGGATIVFVVESPVIGYYPACSPCIPGAGNLDDEPGDENDQGVEHCYDIPADWRAQ